MLDEAERLKQTQCPDVAELLSMLLAGYKRGGQATRLEPLGDTGQFKMICFDVFGPKALACIAACPRPWQADASPVTMFRAGPRSQKPRRRIDVEPGRWQALRDDLHALALEHGQTGWNWSGGRKYAQRWAGGILSYGSLCWRWPHGSSPAVPTAY